MICSICNKPLKPGEYLVKCTKCGKAYHSTCWVKNVGCATPNCHGTPSKQFKGNLQADVDKFTTIKTTVTRYNPKGLKIKKCPVCKKIILNGDDIETCPICETEYHADCWNQKGGCILNCRERTSLQGLSANTGNEKVCPYCMMPIQQGERVISCPKCGIPHHRDCWDENGGCTTYGCDGGSTSQTSITTTNSSPDYLSDLQSHLPSARTCPYCQTEISDHDQVVYCEKCGIPHHKACWIENGGCTTYGCTGSQGTTSQGGSAIPPVVNNGNYNTSGNYGSTGNYGYSNTNYPPPPKDSCGNNTSNCCGIIIFIIILWIILGGCT